ncbi:MAG: S-layer homology domain-containing protein [Tyzzerella sp.]|uniref:S-layer homology domain-containing protein n=1 Tax=Candidatus Fimicola merdigallinarum TaxID=2840819 RepID=A0A9D9H3J7_9FIRM|nr:S-layer homology domain-containing protein [Candidatus Fimicola merdigallinarum]
MKKTVQGATVLFLSMSFCFNTAFAEINTNAHSWAVEYVKKSVELGIMPSEFAYNATAGLTREELCIMAINFYKAKTGKNITVSAKSPFTDAKRTEILQAYELGIMNGTGNNKFEPKKIVNREQLAMVIMRTLKACGMDSVPKTNSKTFNDMDKVGKYAIEGINFVTSTGIMNGSNNSINPLGNVTKEQASTVFMNAYNLTIKKSVVINNKTLNIGDNVSTLTSKFGLPDRVDSSIYGYQRYVYNKDYNNLFMVGVSNGVVVDVCLFGKASGYGNFLIGSAFNSNGVSYDYDKNTGRAILQDTFNNINIYYDSTTKNIHCMKISDKKATPSVNVLNYNSKLENDIELEIFDIINSERAKLGLQPLNWDIRLQASSENHSKDMARNRYVGYNNKDGKTPFERMSQAGMQFKFASETIAMVPGDSIDIMGDFMTNVAKKGNILSKSIDNVGVGVSAQSLNLYVTVDMCK